MKNLKFVILLLIYSICSPNVIATSKYMQLVGDADKAIEKGEYERAIALLQEAVKIEPDNSGNVMVLSNIGMLNYYTGNDKSAVYYLSLAHQMAPESITILSNRAKVFKETGMLVNAMRDYETIVSLDSTLYMPYLNMGVIYLASGDTLQARQALDRVSTLTDTSKSRECAAALAWLASMCGDNREAIRQYSILIAQEPSAALHASRAISHVALENYSDASEDIAEGLSLDPECADVYLARAYLNKQTYRNDDALKDAQKAIDLGADKQRVKAMLGI